MTGDLAARKGFAANDEVIHAAEHVLRQVPTLFTHRATPPCTAQTELTQEKHEKPPA